MTNGDKIRDMDDEELALNFSTGFCYMIPFKECREDKDCVACCMDWLRKEADE